MFIYLDLEILRGRRGGDRMDWIYNYLCNQCLEPLKPDDGDLYLIQHYVMKFVSDRSVVFSGYSVFLHVRCTYVFCTSYIPLILCTSDIPFISRTSDVPFMSCTLDVPLMSCMRVLCSGSQIYLSCCIPEMYFTYCVCQVYL